MNFRIPDHFSHFIWIRIETIVIYLVLQSTPAYVNEIAGYSEVAPELEFGIQNFDRFSP